jgi:hypothetical protein
MESKDIIYPEFKGLYKVCSNGTVYSVRNNKLLKPGIKPKPYDYRVIVLSNKNYKRAYNLHKIIADHFLIKPISKNETYEINHIDMDKSNNNISNLEYVTHWSNMLKARKVKQWGGGRKAGFITSESTKLKQSLKKQKKCVLYNDNERHVFNSIDELIQYVGTYRKAFNRYVNSYKTYKGFYIRYIQ